MKTAEIYIRDAEEKDRREILNLLNDVFTENQRSSTQRDDDYWQWKFKSHLFGSSIISVAEVDDSIVGIDHFWPWQLTHRGEILKSYQPCDSALAPMHRGKGVFTKLRLRGIEEAKRRGGQLLFNFPNANSLPINLRVGAKQLGRITWWVKILEPLNMVKGRLGKASSMPSDINGAFSLDIALLDRISRDYEVFDHLLSINRKPGFFEWRYQNRSNRQYGMISFEREKKMIVGIFTMNEKGASREMVLVDVMGDPKLSGDFFKKTVKLARRLDATFLALMENRKFKTNQLWKNGFIRKKMKNMVVLPIDLSIEREVTNIENWSLMAGMHDSI